MDFPGIAMSRSVGDTYSTTLGVVCEPDIKEAEIDDNAQFIVIASDGVWEFLENKEVMEIVMPYYNSNDVEGACKKLVEEATKNWTENEKNRNGGFRRQCASAQRPERHVPGTARQRGSTRFAPLEISPRSDWD